MGDPEHDFFQNLAYAGMDPTYFALRRYMDDMTLITTPQAAERCYEALTEALTKAGMKLSEDKFTAWTTDGKPPDTQEARTLLRPFDPNSEEGDNILFNELDWRAMVKMGLPQTVRR